MDSCLLNQQAMMCLLSLNTIGNLLFKRPLRGVQLSALGLISLLQGCALSVPAGIEPITGFDANQYLGRWYEIARLDNRFQRGLEQVTATYSLREDGSIRVENTGWNSQNKQKKTIIGRAKFVLNDQIGHLKVSFWGPFYSSYVVFYLEADYSVAMVCGSSRDYCWILARSPVLSAGDIARYRAIAQENGFAVENFIPASGTVPTSNIVDR
jgi:apolipoprotein D and lipocalin family protein